MAACCFLEDRGIQIKSRQSAGKGEDPIGTYILEAQRWSDTVGQICTGMWSGNSQGRIEDWNIEHFWKNMAELNEVTMPCKMGIIMLWSSKERIWVIRQGFLKEIGLKLVLKRHMIGFGMAETLPVMSPWRHISPGQGISWGEGNGQQKLPGAQWIGTSYCSLIQLRTHTLFSPRLKKPANRRACTSRLDLPGCTITVTWAVACCPIVSVTVSW